MKNAMGIKKNNCGYTLIELLITMAVMSIAATAIFQLVVVASRHYQDETQEVQVQQEAQLSVNQLQDILIDATEGIAYSINGTNVLSDAGAPATIDAKAITIYNESTYYVIEWDPMSRELAYSEYSIADDGTETAVITDALMAEYVEDFVVDLSDTTKNNCVRLDILFNNTKEYRVTQNVTIRNKVMVNATKAEIYG